MSTPEPDELRDARLELRFALAEGDALDPADALRDRVLAAAIEARPAGLAVLAPDRISGAEAFARIVARLGTLLGELGPAEWAQPAKAYPDVQHLVGHLIGVEQAFLAVLNGADDPSSGSGHRAMTAASIADQDGRDPSAAAADWASCTSEVLLGLAERDRAIEVSFYGTTLMLDGLLVLRAFEMWIHDEDIRRATGRPLLAPDPETLARMVEVAIVLLPIGLELAGRLREGRTARLVLTGPGGGTWDVNLDAAAAVRPAETRVVVDAASFCRVIGDREDVASSGALVDGPADLATDLFVGAAALALD